MAEWRCPGHLWEILPKPLKHERSADPSHPSSWAVTPRKISEQEKLFIMYILKSNKYGEIAEPLTRTEKMAAKNFSCKIFPQFCSLTPRLLCLAGAFGVFCPSWSNVRKQLRGDLENLEWQGQYSNLHLLCSTFHIFPSTWQWYSPPGESPVILHLHSATYGEFNWGASSKATASARMDSPSFPAWHLLHPKLYTLHCEWVLQVSFNKYCS